MADVYLLDLTDAAGSPRALAWHDALGAAAAPVAFDGAWRRLNAPEVARLRRPPRFLDRWLRRAKFARRGSVHAVAADAVGFFAPGLFAAGTATAYPELFTAVRGPRVAWLHDLQPLHSPETAPREIIARLPGYAQELLAFDAIVTESAGARDRLLRYWEWLGRKPTPPVAVISSERAADAGALLTWMRDLPRR